MTKERIALVISEFLLHASWRNGKNPCSDSGYWYVRCFRYNVLEIQWFLHISN